MLDRQRVAEDTEKTICLRGLELLLLSLIPWSLCDIGKDKQAIMRISRQLLQVLCTFRETPAKSLSGSDIRHKTGLGNGTVYPILCRLEQAGWLESSWETVDPSVIGRPRKRLYSLTRTGALKAEAELNLLIQQSDVTCRA